MIFSASNVRFRSTKLVFLFILRYYSFAGENKERFMTGASIINTGIIIIVIYIMNVNRGQTTSSHAEWI